MNNQRNNTSSAKCPKCKTTLIVYKCQFPHRPKTTIEECPNPKCNFRWES